MNELPDYRAATNAAYRMLASKKALSLSTNVFSIVEDCMPFCRLITYSQANALYGCSVNDMNGMSEYGFTALSRKSGSRVILYNEKHSIECIRFTIAHEIGHAALNHGAVSNVSIEREANCFARNLLCPIPIVQAMGARAEEDYMHLFNVSQKMATAAIGNRKQDKYNIDPKLFEIISDMLDAYMMGFDCIDDYYQFLAS